VTILWSVPAFLDEAEHFLHNRSASVATLRELFAFGPECRSRSLRNQRSPSPESPQVATPQIAQRYGGIPNQDSAVSFPQWLSMSSFAGPLGPGCRPGFGENSRRYFRLVTMRWRCRKVEGFSTNCRTEEPYPTNEKHAQAGDHPVTRVQVGRSLAVTVQDQKLVPDQHRLGDHAPDPSGLCHPDDGHDQTAQKDQEIPHHRKSYQGLPGF
jgi:hypothetical protein